MTITLDHSLYYAYEVINLRLLCSLKILQFITYIFTKHGFMYRLCTMYIVICLLIVSAFLSILSASAYYTCDLLLSIIGRTAEIVAGCLHMIVESIVGIMCIQSSNRL